VSSPSADLTFGPLLGEGGGGAVYAARLRGSEVAVKVLRAELALSEKERKRFFEEAERMRRVQHPGLVSLLEVGALADGRPYLVMPLLRGETLAARVARGPIPLAQALPLVAQLAGAVDALHAAGLIHRDLTYAQGVNVLKERQRQLAADAGPPR
jgi:serine/threonine-protein kinase